MRSQLVRLLILGLILGTAVSAPLAQTRTNDSPTGPVLVIVTPSLDFGVLTVGSTDTLRALIANFGDAPLTGYGSIIGPDLTSFTVHDENEGTINPGDTTYIEVMFSPQSPGPKSARLELIGNVDGGPFLISLAGYGVHGFPDLFRDPPFALDFSAVGGLSGPSDVTLDNRNKGLYVADTGNNRIVRWTDDGGSGLATVVALGGMTLNAPRGVAAVGDSDLYISDTGNHRLIRLSAGVPEVIDLSAIGGLSLPWHIIQGESSSVYIADSDNSRIINWRNGIIQVFPITGLTPPLNVPSGLTGDDNTGYVAELNGRLLRFVGNNTTPDVIDPGITPPPVGFTDVAIGHRQTTLFATDAGFSRLLLFPNGLGPACHVDLFRNLSPANLSAPQGLDVTEKGDVLIADTGNDRILVLPGIHESDSERISAHPSELFFGQTPVGQTSQQQLTLQNPNDQSVYVSGVGIWGGEGSFQTEQGPFTVGPNGNRQVTVWFTPQTDGEKFALLIVWHDSGDSLVVPLFGFPSGQGNVATLKLGTGYRPSSPTGFAAPNFGPPGADVDLQFSLLNPTGQTVGGLQFTIQLPYADDANQFAFLGITPSDALQTQGFALYTNSNLKSVNTEGDTIPEVRIVVAPQFFEGINPGLLPAGDIPLGNLHFRIGSEQQNPPETWLLGRSTRLALIGDHIVSDGNGQLVPTIPNDQDAAIHVGQRGGVSMDGRIDVRDVVLEVRIILGFPIHNGGYYQYQQPISTGFLIADMQPDGVLNVLDVITQINRILGIEQTVGPKAIAGAIGRLAEVRLGSVSTRPNGQMVIPVWLDTDQSLAGAEFTFAFDPTELRVGTPELAAASSGLTLDYRIADGTLRLIVYNLTAGGGITSGRVAWLPVTLHNSATAPTLTMTEALLGTQSAEKVALIITTASQTIEKRSPLPDAYALIGAHPNPFNPVTTISYALPEQANAKVVVFNILGQEIRTLVSGVQPAGYYNVVWDGRDNTGIAVGSGVYLYRLTAGSFVESKRMTLLK